MRVDILVAIGGLVVLATMWGCDVGKIGLPEWEKAPRNHTCTEEQMARVEKETTWCSANTENSKGWCYGAAIMRNCTPMEKK
jgi:hypothetical protein